MLTTFLAGLITSFLAFAFIGWLSDKQAATNKDLTPGLKLLPGDVSWQNEKGNVRVFFPITSSIVLSVVLSLVMWFLNR
jgi:Na+/H+ antiporter NhaC